MIYIDVFYDGDTDEGVEKMTTRVRNYTSAFAQSGGSDKEIRFQPYPDDDKYPKYIE